MQAIWTAALLAGGLLGHPDHHEDRLLFHFAVGTHPIRNGAWEDVSHQATAILVGKPELEQHGPSECLRFDRGERLSLSRSLDEARTILPTREFSVSAWVSLAETRQRGGLVGCFQDNDGAEQGWLLGYEEDRFCFALATTGADDGDGRFTRLRAGSAVRRDGWHYVVATYDGQAMKLYVDGLLSAESGEQSGDILYPAESEYTIGALVDRNENHPLRGALFEAKAYRRALSAEEIAKIADKNRNLLAWLPAEEELSFLVRPYLQFGTLDSMTILCETSRPTKMEVRYAEIQPLEQSAATTELKPISELTLAGLKPHTRYFYQVVCTEEAGAQVESQIHSFQTAPPADRPWAFAVIGDTQRNPEVTRKCAEGAYALRPNFLLHCGDVVDDGFAKNQWLKDLFEPCARLMAHVPTFPVIGNHEKDSHWYYDYFSMPKPEYWYTFRYGNAQFFMLDTNRSLAPGSEQIQWLEKELAASTAAWKFAAHHHPCFSSDEDDYGDQIRGNPKRGPFTYGDPNAQHAIPLYEKYGVDIVFNGHIHVYERTWPILAMAINQDKGIRYITSGGGGGHLEHPAPQRTWFSLHVQRAFHYCQAAIHDRTIVFKAFDIEGRMFDSFELKKPTPATSSEHAAGVVSEAAGATAAATSAGSTSGE